MAIPILLTEFITDIVASAIFNEVRDYLANKAAHEIHERFGVNVGWPLPRIVKYDKDSVEYDFNYLYQATHDALDLLKHNAPRKSGRFQRNFFTIVDGVYHAPGNDPKIDSDTAQVVIGNLEPYDRKVEVQTSNGKPIRFSIPAGIYEAAVQFIANDFGGAVVAQVVTDLDFPGKYVRRHPGQFTSPALVLSMPQTGISGYVSREAVPLVGSTLAVMGVKRAAAKVLPPSVMNWATPVISPLIGSLVGKVLR